MIDDDNLDWDHGQTPDSREIGLRLAGLIAEKHLGSEENISAVKDEFITEYERLVESGEVWSPARKVLAAQQAWTQVNDKARRISDRIIVDLGSGHIDIPGLLAQLPHLVVVGRKRRVSIRTLTGSDVELMVEVRILNRDQTIASTAIFEDAATVVIKILNRYGDLGTALTNGAFGSESAA